MSKRELIQKIHELDGSCSLSYLATFDRVDLEYHLRILEPYPGEYLSEIDTEKDETSIMGKAVL